MKITRKQLSRIIKESLISEQVMWHSTAPENVEAILSQGLQTGRESANTIAGSWADEFYGTRPIYLSVQKGKYEGQPLAVNVSDLGLVADLPTLVDTGAYQEEEGMYWDEGSEPDQMIDIVDEDGMVYFDDLLSPGSAAAQAAIDVTGTAAVVQDIPSKSIATEESGLKSDKPPAAESEWASKSQEDKDAHVKNAVWETMAWKRYRKYAQAEGLPFDPDNEADMKIARSWWSKQPESKQFESRIRITRGQIRELVQENLFLSRYRSYQSSGYPSYIFDRSYASGVLGVRIPLNEAFPYSYHLHEEIIYEHLLFEGFWGDLLQKGKDKLLDAKEGIKKFGKETWAVLAALYEVAKGGAQEISSFTGAIAKKGINKILGKIKEALKWMVEKLPEWDMPTFANWAQKGLDAISSLENGINDLDGWKRVISFAGLAVGLHWLWDKVGGWIDDLKEKVGDFAKDLASDVIDPIKEWIKETAMENLKSIGGNAFKSTMGTLSSALTGIKPWWDAAVKVAGGVKLVIDALGSAAARFMGRQEAVKNLNLESITQGRIMKITKRQLRRIIREELVRLDEGVDPRGLKTMLKGLGVTKAFRGVSEALSIAFYEFEGDAADMKEEVEVNSGGYRDDSGQAINWTLDVYQQIHDLYSKQRSSYRAPRRY